MADTTKKKSTSKKKTEKKRSAAAQKSKNKKTEKKPGKKKVVESVKKPVRKKSVKKQRTDKGSGEKSAGKRSNSLIPAKLPADTTSEIKTTYKKDTYPEEYSKNNLPEKTEDDEYTSAKERGDEPMSVVGHLDEMRSRILQSLIAVIVLTFAGFFLSDHLLEFMNAPFVKTGHKLNIFKLTGGFIIRIKAALVAGLMIGLPFIIYQIWKFISPAISKKDRKFSIISLICAFFLFYGGMAFVFFILLPFAIDMLLSFIGDDMLSTIGASDYMSFILLMSVAMGILFELPIVVMILTRIGLITPRFLITKRKYSVVIIWIIAAVITPQDVLSQVLVAVPLMLLYEISIVISRIIFIRKRKREALD